ncbi:MAG: hypothetical protein EA397_11920 [Deltaproteobacteria bacterium]|nr:MAG: hypothetical protein EA397_11920 [Deltaproteobacteria bacterium]
MKPHPNPGGLSPLDVDDERYIPPPGLDGASIVDRVRRGLTPILLSGHGGLGKTSLLRRVYHELREQDYAVLFDLRSLRRIDPDRVLYDLAVETVQAWVRDGPERQPSPFLVQDLRASDPSFPQGQGRTLSPTEIAIAAWDELTGAADLADSLPLLVDGVDALEPELARAILAQLLHLRPRADLVVTAAPSVSYGPENVGVLDAWRVLNVAPADPETPEGAAFLRSVVKAHGGQLPDEVVDEVVRASGGVLRDLVFLLLDAHSYADEEIDMPSVQSAIADRMDRMRRLLIAGDREALANADGTSGLEIAADRKTRLLEHGLLLEYGRGASSTTRLHPLLRPLLDLT